MEAISSKIKFNKKDLMDLYEVLFNQKSLDDSIVIPNDLKLIHFSLRQKIDEKMKKKKENYVLDLNAFEILYIQLTLQSVIPYLGIKAAECQNYMFENRDVLKPCEFQQLKEIHNNIFSIYGSLNRLTEKLQNLSIYYKDYFNKIRNMNIDERIHFYLDINGQIETEKEKLEKIIPLHREL